MERLNWAVLGLMGIVTALGLTTSSGAGKAQNELADGTKFAQVIECSPIGAAPSSDNAPIELATSIPASSHSHSGCTACQAKKAAAATDTDNSAPSSTAFDELLAMIEKNVKATTSTGNLAAGDCPGNCHETGVCCDKSLNKSDSAVASKTSAPGCIGECHIGLTLHAEKSAVDSPLTRAAEMIENLTKNHICEGGECLTKQGQGTLTITAAEPAAKPEGLLNLLAAAETVKAEDKPAGEPICRNFTLTINGTPDAQGNTLTLNANTAETKPTVDHSRAAARAAKLAALEKRMAEEISFNLNQNKLDDIVEQIRTEKRIEVQLDLRALEELAFDTASPFDYVINNIECGEALRTILHAKRLTWIIPESNDLVLITSESAAESTLLPRVYEVSDLTDEPGILMERIQAIVNPERWKANGGQNDLAVWQSGEQAQLAVNADFWTHRKLANFFDDLRAARAASPKRLAQAPAPNLPLLRTYELPSLAQEKDAAVRAKQFAAWKGTLQLLLKDTEGFDPTMFETMEFGNRTVLMAKQLPAVHQEIERVFKLLKQHEGFGGCVSIIPVVGSRMKPAVGIFSVAP